MPTLEPPTLEPPPLEPPEAIPPVLLLVDKRSEERCILFAALVPKLDGGDFPFVCLLAVLVWLSLATFAWGPLDDLLLRGCFLGVALGTPGLKKRRTEERGRHEGCCVSCTASAAGSVRVSICISSMCWINSSRLGNDNPQPLNLQWFRKKTAIISCSRSSDRFFQALTD